MKAPVPVNGASYDAKYIVQWRNSLVKDASIPSMPFQDDFEAAIVKFEQASQHHEQAQKELDKLNKEKAAEDKLKAAQKRVEEADVTKDQERATTASVAHKILQQLETSSFLTQPLDHADSLALLAAATMMQAGSKKGMAFQQQVQAHGHADLVQFFCNADLMQQFASAGGPNKNEYAKALKILDHIPEPDDPVLQRLRLAVALELCTPVDLKVGKGYEIDPVARYEHYKQAYLAGELDPLFSTFAVWELRMAIDSDARDEELTWGRECLRNYRPDICYMPDPQWRYCMIVKQDVGYNNPDWWRKDDHDKEVRTYDQILSGGGKCGPRAWYGRFACKSFGIPTWGCQQPGHAAMVRHTTKGWMSCLGAGIHKSYWGPVTGNHFLWMTQARYASKTDDEYMKKVQRLEWVATAMCEDGTRVSKIADPSSKALWFSLALFQRKRLGKECTDKCPPLHPKSSIVTMYDKIMKQKEKKEPILKDGHAIVIPASAFTKPPKPNNKVHIHRSFMGGCQIFLQTEVEVEYTLEKVPGRYNLTAMVCTVHRNENPFSVSVDGKDKREIVIPYTMGEWHETEPIEITIGHGSAKLAFKRGSPKYGFAIMQFRLEPV